MNLYIINTGMTLSIILFYAGYFQRIKNNDLHRIINSIGILANLSAAVYLLLGKYIFGGIESMGILSVVPEWAVNTHRFFAAISLILMLIMGYTGYTRKTDIHNKIHKIFLLLYTIIYISGMLIFTNK